MYREGSSPRRDLILIEKEIHAWLRVMEEHANTMARCSLRCSCLVDDSVGSIFRQIPNGRRIHLIAPKGATECPCQHLDHKEERGSSKTSMRGIETGKFGVRESVEGHERGQISPGRCYSHFAHT